MAEPVRPSSWKGAVLNDLACPNCQAQNRPGVHYVKFGESGFAECFVCGYAFAAVQQT